MATITKREWLFFGAGAVIFSTVGYGVATWINEREKKVLGMLKPNTPPAKPADTTPEKKASATGGDKIADPRGDLHLPYLKKSGGAGGRRGFSNAQGYNNHGGKVATRSNIIKDYSYANGNEDAPARDDDYNNEGLDGYYPAYSNAAAAPAWINRYGGGRKGVRPL